MFEQELNRTQLIVHSAVPTLTLQIDPGARFAWQSKSHFLGAAAVIIAPLGVCMTTTPAIKGSAVGPAPLEST